MEVRVEVRVGLRERGGVGEMHLACSTETVVPRRGRTHA